MKRRIVALLVLWTAAVSAEASKAELNQVRLAHERRASTLGTVVITESVHRKVNWAAEEARLVAELDESLAAALSAARRDHEAAGADASSWERVERLIREQFEVRRNGLIANQINSDVTVRRVRTIDLPGARVRWDDTDSRNTTAMADSSGITGAQRANITKSQSSILAEGKHVILYPHLEKLARVAPIGMQNLDHERLRLGLLPAWVFSGDFEITIDSANPKSFRLQGVGATGSFTADLEPFSPFAVLKFQIRGPNDEYARQWGISDYQRASGELRLPKSVTMRVTKNGISDYLVETCETSSVQIQAPSSDAVFLIPADYRVSEVSADTQ